MTFFRLALIAAALLGATGIALGAYSAHGLEKKLEQDQLSSDQIQTKLTNAQTAVQYQLTHALALLALAGLSARRTARVSRGLGTSATFMLLGVICFSGGLYCSVFEWLKLHWAVIPAGGMLMILGWSVLAFEAFATTDP